MSSRPCIVILVVTASSVIQTWPYHHCQEPEMSTDSGTTSDEDNNSYPDSDESRQERCPWDGWDAFAQELDSSNVKKLHSVFSINHVSAANATCACSPCLASGKDRFLPLS